MYGAYVAVCYGYLFASSLFLFFHSFRTDISEDSAEYRELASYTLIPTLLAAVDALIPHTTITALAYLLLLVNLFFVLQKKQISIDALTGLNNRKRMHEYFDKKAENAKQKPFYLFMMDVDDFKLINDNYGHTEGDEALKLLSGALKASASKCGGFIARYGGDEFTYIMDKGTARPEEFIAILRREIAQRGEGKEYDINISVGYTLCCSRGAAPKAVIKEADRMLYEAKSKKKSRRIRTGEPEQERS
jgi:diguanylate cyclase (GGDEF)-like protein